MNKSLAIPVLNNGKVLVFQARLFIVGYIYKFEVDVNGTNILFEPRERESYTFINSERKDGTKKVDFNILKKIARTLERIAK